MPIISSTYCCPRFLRQGDLHTLYGSLFGRAEVAAPERFEIETPDDDFIHLDCWQRGSKSAVIISHGLEGSSRSSYVSSLIQALLGAGYDALVWNFRFCSGVPNRQRYWYHSGKSDDLRTVMQYVLKKFSFESYFLAGFSVGGNIMLKYLGEEGAKVPSALKAAVAVSVPVDLEEASGILARLHNQPYMEYFLRPMRRKIRQKAAQFPDLKAKTLFRHRTFYSIDAAYTAPLNGFAGPLEYWRAASSLPFLKSIRVPTLLLSALDDPFLGPNCFPTEAAQNNPQLFLETPSHGGHVGFMATGRKRWSDTRCIDFFKSS